MYYKTLLISAALLAAAPAFAQDFHGGPGIPPPPPPGGMMQGSAGMQIDMQDPSGMDVHAGMVASTSANWHHPPMPPHGNTASSTNSGMRHNGMASSTNGRPPKHRGPQGDLHPHDNMTGTSTEDTQGTSTPPRGGVAGFFAHLGAFFHTGGGNHNATSIPPDQMDSSVEASSTMSASTTPPAPHDVMGFFAHLFGWLHQ